MTNDDSIDLEGVRRGDAHLKKAKEIFERESRTPRPVPLDEIEEMNQQTYTTDEIAEELNRRGVDRRNGGDWHKVAVHRVLKGAVTE